MRKSNFTPTKKLLDSGVDSRVYSDIDTNSAPPMLQKLQIGQVSKETGLTVDAIRFYEKQKLLRRPLRSAGGFRLFTERDLGDIHFIRQAQELGFSLEEIRELLILQRDQWEACSHVRDLIKSKLDGVKEKMAQLRRLERQLGDSLKKCEHSLKTPRARHTQEDKCPVLAEIAHRTKEWKS
jgi:DNA-binding transcriptional MerR regulator